MEYVSAKRIVDRRRGTVTEYLVEVRHLNASAHASCKSLTAAACDAQWDDGAPATWEIEDHISAEVMQEYLDRTTKPKKKRGASSSTAPAAAAEAVSA